MPRAIEALSSSDLQDPVKLADEIGFLLSCLESKQVSSVTEAFLLAKALTSSKLNWDKIGKELDLLPHHAKAHYGAIRNVVFQGRLNGATLYKNGAPFRMRRRTKSDGSLPQSRHTELEDDNSPNDVEHSGQLQDYTAISRITSKLRTVQAASDIRQALQTCERGSRTDVQDRTGLVPSFKSPKGSRAESTTTDKRQDYSNIEIPVRPITNFADNLYVDYNGTRWTRNWQGVFEKYQPHDE